MTLGHRCRQLAAIMASEAFTIVMESNHEV